MIRLLLPNLPLNVRCYFAAQAVVIPLIYLTQHWKAYPYIYAVATGLVLLTMSHITWEALGVGWRAAAFIGLLAMMVCRMAYLGSGRAFSHADWIVLIEGFLCAWMGIVVGFLAPYLPHTGTMFTLGLGWLGMALYDFGWIIHWPHWLGVNGWLPTAIVLASYVIVLRISREPHPHPYKYRQ